MLNILNVIPGSKKTSSSGWTNFNCPACVHRGHRADTRMRGGVKFDGPFDWRIHCFNCGFSTKFVMGLSLYDKVKKFLTWCGVDQHEIQRWSLESIRNKELMHATTSASNYYVAEFEEKNIPSGQLLDINNPEHQRYIDYLSGRAIKHDKYPFLITPELSGRDRNRIIIPFTYKNKIVGHVSRYLDNKSPKYISDKPRGYLFGYDLQRPEWSVCIVVEGIFDALSLNGCAVMHNTITDEQARILNSLNKPVIVVPDMDAPGFEIIDRAIELGYSVSIPTWHKGVKDVNDAVVKYGNLATLLSIVQSATRSKIKLEIIRRKLIAQRI